MKDEKVILGDTTKKSKSFAESSVFDVANEWAYENLSKMREAIEVAEYEGSEENESEMTPFKLSVIEQAIEAGSCKLGPNWCHEVPYEPLDDPEEVEQSDELRHLHDDFIDLKAQKEWRAASEVPEEVYQSEEFKAIFDVIKNWDIGVPNVYWGYCGGNGSHAYMIYKALQEIKKGGGTLKSPGISLVVQDESNFSPAEENKEVKGYTGSDDQEAITSFAPYLPLD